MKNLRDQKIALICFACGSIALLYSVSIGKGLGLSFTLFFSSIIYIIIDRHKGDHKESLISCSDIKKLRAFYLINTFLLIVFLMFSVYSLVYYRPVWYFFLVSFFCVFIAFEIFTFPYSDSRFSSWIILLQIVLLSASLRWGIFFEFPNLVGSDWYHSQLTKHIVESGHIYQPQFYVSWPPLQHVASEYVSFPFMHLILSVTSLVTSFPYKESLVFSVGIFEISISLFVFLITRRMVVDERLALFSALMIGISNWFIKWGFWLVPQSLGLGFFALLLYILLVRNMKKYCDHFLFFFFLICMILSHTVSSFVLVIAIVSGFIVEFVVSKFEKIQASVTNTIGPYLPLFSLTLVVAYWWFCSNFLTATTFSLKYDLQGLWHAVGIAQFPPTIKSYFHYEFDNIGIYMFYSLAMIGSLDWLKERKRNTHKLFTIAGAITMLSFLYGFWFFGLRSILSERWFPFVLICLAAPAVNGLKCIIRVVKRKYRLVIVFLLIFSFAFLMTTTGDANMDSPLFGKREVILYSYKESEIAAANAISNLFNGNIYSDTLFFDYFCWELQRNFTSIDFYNFNSKSVTGIVIIRRYIYERPTTLRLFGPTVLVNQTFEERLRDIDIVYSNNEVTIYKTINNSTK